MAYRSLEINVISAKDLSKTHAYAIVSISKNPRASKQQRTAVDRSGNASPTWNHPLIFKVEESAALSSLCVTFKIRCKRTFGDKDIGEVHVPLIGPTEGGELLQSVTEQVRRPSGKPNKGELNFSYKWWPTMSQEPVTAYPAQVGPSPVSAPPQPVSVYPYQYPQPQPGPVSAPPQPAYLYQYPPPQPAYLYQYPPPQLGPVYPPPQLGPVYPPPQLGPVYPPPPPVNGPPVQQPPNNNWLARCVELVKLCLCCVITDGFGSDPGM